MYTYIDSTLTLNYIGDSHFVNSEIKLMNGIQEECTPTLKIILSRTLKVCQILYQILK